MYQYQCPHCGKTCSTQSQVQSVKCPYCGKDFTVAYQQNANAWGNPQGPSNAYGAQGGYYPQQEPDIFSNGPSGKSRGVAGLLAILLGSLGVHYFYIGKSTAGIIFLAITLVSCGILGTVVAIMSLIQGIMMMTMSQSEFETKYVNSPDSIPLF